MMETDKQTEALPPLGRFLRDYADLSGGVWDEVEPAVYDLLVDDQVVRVTFDPEAIAEHPQAQLAEFGSPLVSSVLESAARRGTRARAWVNDLNLSPHDLPSKLQRVVRLFPDHRIEIERVRAMFFPQAMFWFQATFVSDRKEQEMLSVAIDLYQGRQVRHLDTLTDSSRLSDVPAVALPEAPHGGIRAGYGHAREQVVRSLVPLTNHRKRDLVTHIERQVVRMKRYYAQVLSELDAREDKAGPADAGAASKFASRRAGVERERDLRVMELTRKGQLNMDLRLANLLVIDQPKLLLKCRLSDNKRHATGVDCVWDPLVGAFEPIGCPACRQPTFALLFDRTGAVRCQGCLR